MQGFTYDKRRNSPWKVNIYVSCRHNSAVTESSAHLLRLVLRFTIMTIDIKFEQHM